MSEPLDYRRLTTPPADGDVLIEPPPGQWPALLEENQKALDRQTLSLAGRPLHEVRVATRQAMAGRDPQGPVIAGGHQPGFAHPGVWAKHVVLREAAGRCGAAPLNLIVDNDAPADPDLIVLAVADGLVYTMRIAFSNAPAGCAYEGRPSADAASLQRIRQEADAALGHRLEQSLLPQFLDGSERTDTVDFVDQHIAGRLAVDRSLRADIDEFRVSRFFGGPFVADVLLNAVAFADAYNQALRAYRRREKVRSPDRPLPDLGRDGARIESPLWIYKPLERRRRLWIEPQSDRLLFYADTQKVGELGASDLTRDADAAMSSLRPWLIRPRALTLTLWARLLVCDLFVHGIGGAKYDRITDDIFREYYRCEPPAMTCVSATLRLPLPHHPVTPEHLRSARRELRDVRFNPDRYLSSPPGDMLQNRQQLISQSQQLREAGADRMARRQVFVALREINERLLESDPALQDRLRHRADQVASQLESNRVADSREFFYALQPRERLEMLADRLRGAWAR